MNTINTLVLPALSPKAQVLHDRYVGFMVYHNYGQIGFGVVTGVDDTDPEKPRLRVKFTRNNTPEHILKYADRNERVRRLLPQSVTVSQIRYNQYNQTTKIL